MKKSNKFLCDIYLNNNQSYILVYILGTYVSTIIYFVILYFNIL